MNVTIIIVNYNTLNTTKDCINSIFENTKDIDFEVILVDNDSHDGSKEFFTKDKRILFIESGKNLGFGKANNLGFKYAKGKYIFLLNSDTILLNNAVKKFYDAMENQTEDIACMGTILKASDGITNNNSYGKLPTISSTIKSLLGIYLKMNIKKDTEKIQPPPFLVEYVIGADLFIRRNVIEKLGLFDPDFFMYFEESEMQYRYRSRGYKSMIISDPQIIHLECVSVGGNKQYSYRQRSMYLESMFMYMRKRYSKLSYFIFRLIAIFYLPIILKKRYTFVENLSLVKRILF